MTTRVVLHPQKLAELLRGEQGPVVRRLLEDGEFVKDYAQRHVGVHRPTPGERRSRRPGTLRDSIVKRVVQRGDQVAVEVGSSDKIALLHHKGTPSHPITGKPLLVFYWGKFGKVVAFRKVKHPGTSPNRYLTDGLDALRRRY